MRIGVLGTGTIASALVRSIAHADHRIIVSKRGASISAALQRDHPAIAVAENQSVVDASDVIILGLRADDAPAVLQTLQFRPEQRVISLIAGVTPATLSILVAPADVEAIMLPFPAIEQGGSPILVLGRSDLLTELFGDRNSILVMADEVELQAYLCAQAILSPIACLVDEAATWLGARGHDGGAAEAFLRSLVASSLSAGPVGALLGALDTEGGYNQRLRRQMEASGMRKALREGLDRLARSGSD